MVYSSFGKWAQQFPAVICPKHWLRQRSTLARTGSCSLHLERCGWWDTQTFSWCLGKRELYSTFSVTLAESPSEAILSHNMLEQTLSVDLRSRCPRVSGGRASGCWSFVAAIKGPLHNPCLELGQCDPERLMQPFISRPEFWGGGCDI